MIKHRMTHKEVSETLYKSFPEQGKKFIEQFTGGWSSWHVAEGVEMKYKGDTYRLVAQDNRGHDFYKNDKGNHLLVFDARIIEITD